MVAGSVSCAATAGTRSHGAPRLRPKSCPDRQQCCRDSISSAVWSEAMQPSSEAVGELKPNGSPAGSSSEPTTGEVNGASSAEIHQLLQALQAVRVGDSSVPMSGHHV